MVGPQHHDGGGLLTAHSPLLPSYGLVVVMPEEAPPLFGYQELTALAIPTPEHELDHLTILHSVRLGHLHGRRRVGGGSGGGGSR